MASRNNEKNKIEKEMNLDVEKNASTPNGGRTVCTNKTFKYICWTFQIEFFVFASFFLQKLVNFLAAVG